MHSEAPVPIAHEHIMQLTIRVYYILREGKWDGEEQQKKIEWRE